MPAKVNNILTTKNLKKKFWLKNLKLLSELKVFLINANNIEKITVKLNPYTEHINKSKAKPFSSSNAGII